MRRPKHPPVLDSAPSGARAPAVRAVMSEVWVSRPLVRGPRPRAGPRRQRPEQGQEQQADRSGDSTAEWQRSVPTSAPSSGAPAQEAAMPNSAGVARPGVHAADEVGERAECQPQRVRQAREQLVFAANPVAARVGGKDGADGAAAVLVADKQRATLQDRPGTI